ncbi:hypothetical protein DL766_008822 [Monosporascus sp. MC13-8B]|uniref:Gfd2/YDR514C-like C-terminal domain-containing protein n=1 Tax=Monosporascus cannonballus TaxID=155416 RepID=A0ABY0H686_9PEZI|nr:hypothetical protein DL763_010595 [Monosporascus cannonballus]RYO82672.1 hypothetical protein DL762_006489 [Monosporascus cannonballus]RYP17789.1 hypothetical protein DL766_008822 [Monosporascus sp. MC13-8B]
MSRSPLPVAEVASNPQSDAIHDGDGSPRCPPSLGPHADITIAGNGLEILLELFGLSVNRLGQTSWSDAILVAIDFENIGDTKDDLDLNFQGGLAILDLGQALSRPPEGLIKTYNFASGSSAYCGQAQQDRNIVLVGHDIRHDIIALENLKWTFKNSVIAILGTYRMSGQVLPWVSLTLVELLNELGCPSTGLHCAGNDAYFTLRALLCLAAKRCRNEAANLQNLAVLQRIATSPVQRRLHRHEKAEKRRQKSRQKTKKYQSQFWDDETKEKIRLERAAKKLSNNQEPQIKAL